MDTLYPLDYQLTLGRILRERLARAPAGECRQLEDAIARLYAPDFGSCVACGSLIPYAVMTADPATRQCPNCRARLAH